jgi:hypothetical protein
VHRLVQRRVGRSTGERRDVSSPWKAEEVERMALCPGLRPRTPAKRSAGRGLHPGLPLHRPTGLRSGATVPLEPGGWRKGSPGCSPALPARYHNERGRNPGPQRHSLHRPTLHRRTYVAPLASVWVNPRTQPRVAMSQMRTASSVPMVSDLAL